MASNDRLMATKGDDGVLSPLSLPALVYRLCSKMCPGSSDDHISSVYKLSFQLLNRPSSQLGECEELYFMGKIKEKLLKEFRHSDGLRVEELYSKLKRISQFSNNLIALLQFFYLLSNANDSNNSADQSKLSLLTNGSATPTEPYRSFVPRSGSSNYLNGSQPDLAKMLPVATSSLGASNFCAPMSPTRKQNAVKMRPKKPARPHTIHIDGGSVLSAEVSENELIREILFAFQGLKGKIIEMDPKNEGRFFIKPQYVVSPSRAAFALRLTNMGWLFKKINKYCSIMIKESTCGQVCQSFAAALQEEIIEHYRLITVIEEQLHESVVADYSNKESPTVSGVTLHRLQVWCFEPFSRLKKLALLVDQCKTKKGGALASVVYHSMQHGDAQIRNCISRIFNQVVLPIRRMLSHWIFHGELEDNYKEFFISTNRANSHSMSSFWRDKYTINSAMLPGFITRAQAEKILTTGKAIYMLHQVCRDEVTNSVARYNDLKMSFESSNIESLFNKKRNGEESEFQILLDSAYKEISQTSLKNLFDKFNLMDHFRGLRQYMLLGQGDFIRHLMDVLAKQLDKPAEKVARHIVVPLLETAIRSTNAQYDDAEILNRIDVRLLDTSINETGWDVFTLAYRIDGPIAAVFDADSQKYYSRLFKHLWRSKRIEYVLNNIWKTQMTYVEYVDVIPELKPVYHSFHMLISEMMHFIQQMEYYLTFEVIECQWADLVVKLTSAQDVDQLIKAHWRFIEEVFTRSLLASRDLSDQYRAICDNILDFQKYLERFWRSSEDEVSRRNRYHAKIEANTERGDWGVTENEEHLEMERREQFVSDAIPKAKVRMVMLSKTYQDIVQRFLVMLAAHEEKDFQNLSSRLDFNEHYKKRDKLLETSFTFGSHKQRLSMSMIETTSTFSNK